MPILPSIPVIRLSPEEFRDIAFDVMNHVFAIHNEFGRLFNERVYKLELSSRMQDVLLEAAVNLVFRTFTKNLFIDVLVASGGLFEFKAAAAIHAKHRAQCIQYLLLLDLAHGKVINVRTQKVQHEFVNCNARLADSRNPIVQNKQWDPSLPNATFFRDTIVDLVRDWGSGLMIELYEEAVTHSLGGDGVVIVDVPIIGSKGQIALQRMRLAAPDIAFKITALSKDDHDFSANARRLLQHTSLKAILWANISNNIITFTSIR